MDGSVSFCLLALSLGVIANAWSLWIIRGYNRWRETDLERRLLRLEQELLRALSTEIVFRETLDHETGCLQGGPVDSMPKGIG